MRWFSFVTKLAALCNIMFIVGFIMHYIEYQLPLWLAGTVLVLGWFPVGPTVNTIFVVSLIFILISNKRDSLPLYLTIFNVLIAVLQFIFFLTNVISI